VLLRAYGPLTVGTGTLTVGSCRRWTYAAYRPGRHLRCIIRCRNLRVGPTAYATRILNHVECCKVVCIQRYVSCGVCAGRCAWVGTLRTSNPLGVDDLIACVNFGHMQREPPLVETCSLLLGCQTHLLQLSSAQLRSSPQVFAQRLQVGATCAPVVPTAVCCGTQ
jgi:hypothetical protein